MATPGGRSRTGVVGRLEEEAWAFDFYQVVRLLEWMRPGARSVGTGPDPSREAVRFRSEVSLGFPASEVTDVRLPDEEGDPARVAVTFLGLAGAQGPLPRPVTDLIIQRTRRGDTAFRDFLDVFNHRLISLLYRARVKHRVGLAHESPEESDLARMIFALMGLGTPGVRGRVGVQDRSLLRYGGTLARRPRSAAGLEGILRHHFGLPVAVRQFVGRWRTLASDQRTVLGPNGRNRRLGRTAVLGGRTWDQAGEVQILIGPLKLDDFRRFLPGGDRLEPLWGICKVYLSAEMDVSFRLLLEAEEVPESRLDPRGTTRLGQTSWLKTRPFERPADGVVVR